MNILILNILFGIIPLSGEPDRVYYFDTIELNHFYHPDDGELVIDQYLYKAKIPGEQFPRVVYWAPVGSEKCRIKDDKVKKKWESDQYLLHEKFQLAYVPEWKLPFSFPVKMPNGKYLSILFVDGQVIHIWADIFKETWTNYDAEIYDRHVFPKDKRPDYYPPQIGIFRQ